VTPPVDRSRFGLPPVLWLWGPVVLCMAAIFVVSSLSRAPLPEGMSDKTGHVLGYAGLGLTVARALAGGLGRRFGIRGAVLAVAITVAYGMTDEFHQRFVPGRSSDIRDVYADAIGAIASTAVLWAWGIIRPRSDDV